MSLPVQLGERPFLFNELKAYTRGFSRRNSTNQAFQGYAQGERGCLGGRPKEPRFSGLLFLHGSGSPSHRRELNFQHNKHFTRGAEGISCQERHTASPRQHLHTASPSGLRRARGPPWPSITRGTAVEPLHPILRSCSLTKLWEER